jgi:hypothetical protein
VENTPRSADRKKDKHKLLIISNDDKGPNIQGIIIRGSNNVNDHNKKGKLQEVEAG